MKATTTITAASVARCSEHFLCKDYYVSLSCWCWLGHLIFTRLILALDACLSVCVWWSIGWLVGMVCLSVAFGHHPSSSSTNTQNPILTLRSCSLACNLNAFLGDFVFAIIVPMIVSFENLLHHFPFVCIFWYFFFSLEEENIPILFCCCCCCTHAIER